MGEDAPLPGRAEVGRVCRSGCSSSAPEPVPAASGAVAAWARSPPCRSIADTVRPPPTSATAVATTARRWFFLRRACRRRRAARPCGAGGRSGRSSAGSVSWAEGDASPEAMSEADTSQETAGPVVAMVTGAGATRPSAAAGAMSGAQAPHPGHTRAPLRCRRHEEQ
ncbi:hypothetical protein F7R91_15120 [Streptomyces luteolifulvus]|uniref:Uncharacterized protein n=1 Tax=Streptomyces luteolifulvus TaxID=2615112 RepID=A0A6H9V2N2_9ACTN|nr:hypothetical protein F7R91_15120 [Streptomyces luteolifulvus]